MFCFVESMFRICREYVFCFIESLFCREYVLFFREYVLDLLDLDRKFLIFAHHQEVLDAIEAAVQSKVR